MQQFTSQPPAPQAPVFVADPKLPLLPAIPGGRVQCGDIDIRIDRDGTWFYHESPIGRKELVRLFASVLTRDKFGDYWLVTPAEAGRIRVADAPFLAIGMDVSGTGRDQRLCFRTNIDQTVTANADLPIRVVTHPGTGEPSPYMTVRPRLEARIARSVYYDLVSLGTEEVVDNEPVYGVWSGGAFFVLGRLDPAP